MNLVFLSNDVDILMLNDVTSSRVSSFNTMDIQSILSGLSRVFQDFLFDDTLVNVLLNRLMKINAPLNSLTITNLMKSVVALRIHNPAFYKYIVQ